jgi:protocatechuate 3,4-dioxygenase beta subunit
MTSSPHTPRAIAAPGIIASNPTGASRRALLKTGAAALALAGSGRWLHPAAAQDAATATPADLCVLTPELTEGPYYLDDQLLRQDITAGQPGVSLKLRIGVTDIATCVPLANAAVDVWHCDAKGYYSGIAANRPGPDADPAIIAQAATQTFLRGIQLTDADGFAEFDTIYPGWYQGRTIHIHLKVHVGGDEQDDRYQGGHVAHTGQLFFDDAISDRVFATAKAYAGRPDELRTRNADDGILGNHAAEPGFIIALTPVQEDTLADGFTGTIVFGVDPTAAPEPTGFGGGSPGPPPNGGPPPNAGA